MCQKNEAKTCKEIWNANFLDYKSSIFREGKLKKFHVKEAKMNLHLDTSDGRNGDHCQLTVTFQKGKAIYIAFIRATFSRSIIRNYKKFSADNFLFSET